MKIKRYCTDHHWADHVVEVRKACVFQAQQGMETQTSCWQGMQGLLAKGFIKLALEFFKVSWKPVPEGKQMSDVTIMGGQTFV